MASTSPLDALDDLLPGSPVSGRIRFHLRTISNAFFVLAIFIPAALVLSFIPFGWIGQVLLIGILFFLFFFVWPNRIIWIRCNHCHKRIATATPWRCGHCGKANKSVGQFPFVHKCEHCGQEPKSYKCHHRGCGGLIFLTNERQVDDYATYLYPEPAKPPPIDPNQEANQKRELEHQIVMEELKQKYDALKRRKGPAEQKSGIEAERENVERFVEEKVGISIVLQEQKLKHKQKYGDGPECKRADLAADEWARKRLAGEE